VPWAPCGLTTYLGGLQRAQVTLASAFRRVAHGDEPDITRLHVETTAEDGAGGVARRPGAGEAGAT
jgi:hypothetical protein